MILDEDNCKKLKSSGIIIFFSIPVETQLKRIKNHNKRPLVQGKDVYETLKKIYKVRYPIYRNVSDFMIRTEGFSIKQLANQAIQESYKFIINRPPEKQ